MAALCSKRFKLHECIEKAFFKTILVICLVGCSVAILVDCLVLHRVDTNFHITVVFLQVLVVTLYGLNRMKFSNITTSGLVMMCAIFTYRGLITSDFNEVTCTILITIGFIAALVCRVRTASVLTTIIFICLLVILFKNFESVPLIVLIRKAIPYIIVFSIVTVCSGVLKSRYEHNQTRLRNMVELLNRKNLKIKDQHVMLKKNYQALADLNENLEVLVTQKTEKIMEKNRQLADVVYANAHTIRGPLARILGLINLSQLEPQRQGQYLQKISKEAQELDEILSSVTKKIEMNIHR